MVPKENTCILQKTTCICRKLQKIVGPFITHPLIKGGTSQKAQCKGDSTVVQKTNVFHFAGG